MLCVIAVLVLMFFVAPRWGHKNVLIYIFICSILGAFTVMSCKGLSLGLKELFSGTPSISSWFTLLFAFLLIVCVIIQMNYLNKSLDIFNTPIVTTVYYVLFTLFVMAASAILFKEFFNLAFTDILGMLCGFATIVCALFLIQFFKTDKEPKEKKKKTGNGIIQALFRDGVAPAEANLNNMNNSPPNLAADLAATTITSASTPKVGVVRDDGTIEESFSMRVIGDSDRQVWAIIC